MVFVPVAKRNGLTVDMHFIHRHLCLFLVGNPLQQRKVWFTGQGDWLHCPLRYGAFNGMFDVKRHTKQRKHIDIISILDYRYSHKYISPNDCIPHWKYVIKTMYTAKEWLSISCESMCREFNPPLCRFGTHNKIQIMWNDLILFEVNNFLYHKIRCFPFPGNSIDIFMDISRSIYVCVVKKYLWGSSVKLCAINKGPGTQKRFPFDDVIMFTRVGNDSRMLNFVLYNPRLLSHWTFNFQYGVLILSKFSFYLISHTLMDDV